MHLTTDCSTQQPKSFFNKKYVGLQNPPMTYFPCYSKYKLKSLPRFTSVTWPCLVLSPELHPYRSLSPLQTHFLPAPCSSDAPGEVTPLGLCWLASSSSLKGHPHSHLLPLLLPGLCSIVLSSIWKAFSTNWTSLCPLSSLIFLHSPHVISSLFTACLSPPKC